MEFLWFYRHNSSGIFFSVAVLSQGLLYFDLPYYFYSISHIDSKIYHCE